MDKRSARTEKRQGQKRRTRTPAITPVSLVQQFQNLLQKRYDVHCIFVEERCEDPLDQLVCFAVKLNVRTYTETFKAGMAIAAAAAPFQTKRKPIRLSVDVRWLVVKLACWQWWIAVKDLLSRPDQKPPCTSR